MAEPIKTKGLVIRETAVGESDKILTVLTPDIGKISVYCRGVRSIKSHRIAAAQLFCYDEITLIPKADKYTLGEAALIENFFDIRADIVKFALAQYFADVLCEISIENEDQSELLSLALNTLYTLTTDKSASLVKSVFELRALCAIGLTPDLSGCDVCSKVENEYYFDPIGGTVRCSDCFLSGVGNVGQERAYLLLRRHVLRAMEFIIGANRKRIFAFTAETELLDDLSDVCEKYLLAQVGRGFDSLNFYKSL